MPFLADLPQAGSDFLSAAKSRPEGMDFARHLDIALCPDRFRTKIDGGTAPNAAGARVGACSAS
jgi:hypothetical protein